MISQNGSLKDSRDQNWVPKGFWLLCPASGQIYEWFKIPPRKPYVSDVFYRVHGLILICQIRKQDPTIYFFRHLRVAMIKIIGPNRRPRSQRKAGASDGLRKTVRTCSPFRGKSFGEEYSMLDVWYIWCIWCNGWLMVQVIHEIHVVHVVVCCWLFVCRWWFVAVVDDSDRDSGVDHRSIPVE